MAVLEDTPTQVVTVDYLADVRASVVNERYIDIRPVGIYEGGYISYTVDTANLKVKPLVCEIRSNDGAEHQVRVETSDDAELSPGNTNEKYVVLRWTYSAAGPATNQLTVHVVTLANINTYDLLVGVLTLGSGPKITNVAYYASGDTVSEHYEGGAVRSSVAFKRTSPDLPMYKLKVVPDPQTNRGVIVREGWAKAGGTTVYVNEQRVTITAGAGFVYIDTNGVPQYLGGSSYGSNLVLATVTTASPVTAAAIVDARRFIGQTGVAEYAYGSVAGSDVADRVVTLPFTPIFVRAFNSAKKVGMYWTKGFPSGQTKGDGEGDILTGYMTILNNTITFHYAKGRLNSSGKTMYYVALGGGVNVNPA